MFSDLVLQYSIRQISFNIYVSYFGTICACWWFPAGKTSWCVWIFTRWNMAIVQHRIETSQHIVRSSIWYKLSKYRGGQQRIRIQCHDIILYRAIPYEAFGDTIRFFPTLNDGVMLSDHTKKSSTPIDSAFITLNRTILLA